MSSDEFATFALDSFGTLGVDPPKRKTVEQARGMVEFYLDRHFQEKAFELSLAGVIEVLKAQNPSVFRSPRKEHMMWVLIRVGDFMEFKMTNFEFYDHFVQRTSLWKMMTEY
jgi:hypothetical protein